MNATIFVSVRRTLLRVDLFFNFFTLCRHNFCSCFTDEFTFGAKWVKTTTRIFLTKIISLDHFFLSSSSSYYRMLAFIWITKCFQVGLKTSSNLTAEWQGCPLYTNTGSITTKSLKNAPIRWFIYSVCDCYKYKFLYVTEHIFVKKTIIYFSTYRCESEKWTHDGWLARICPNSMVTHSRTAMIYPLKYWHWYAEEAIRE